MAFLGMTEAGPNEHWQCLRCGKLFAEYVNGCPACEDQGAPYGSVRLVKLPRIEEERR